MANESTFCFRMNATERAQLEAIAYAQGRTSSAIAREVLSRFLDGFFSGPQGKTVLAEFRAMKEEETRAQLRKLDEMEALLRTPQADLPAPPQQSRVTRRRAK